jgi:3-ketosteroid 9alpha-monooxygenase subunit A
LTLFRGWYQVAFTKDRVTPIMPLRIGSQRLIIISETSGAVRAYDANCPHRGADLALGNLHNDSIICPFHGYHIHLGDDPDRRFCVREHEAMSVSGLVFVRLNGGENLGFSERMKALDRRCWIVPGFEMSLQAAHELVGENAFDGAHFHTVHQVQNHPRVDVTIGRTGELVGSGVLEVPLSAWQRTSDGQNSVTVPISISAYSPGVVVSDMGGMHPYSVVTTATPTTNGCTVRVSFGMPRTAMAGGPDQKLCAYMIAQSRKGLEADKIIWESLAPGHVPSYAAEDASVIAYRQFCSRFEDAVS